MDTATQLKLEQQRDDAQKKIEAHRDALAQPPQFTRGSYLSQNEANVLLERQKRLVAVFGEAAVKKAQDALDNEGVRSFYSSILLLDPATQRGLRYGMVTSGAYKKLPLNKVFPTLKPKEREAVKTDLEKIGFVFEGQKPVGFKFS